MHPVISIIIPCYNQGQYIMDAITSVEQYQDKSVYEIIIINDGSTDEVTKSVLKSLEDKGYRVVNQDNQGLSMARNNGITIAKGKYILPLDADNKIRPAYIDNGIRILNTQPEIGIVYGSSLRFGEEDEIYRPGEFKLKKLMIQNYIDACIVMRKEVWRQVGGYDPAISPFADWDMNLSAAVLNWKFHYIPEVMFDYRVRKDSMLRQVADINDFVNYISKKHGNLYRTQFLKTITITDRLKSVIFDLYRKLTGRPEY